MAKKLKPVLKVSKDGFIDFMMDDDGLDTRAVKKALKKKGSLTLEDLVKDCGYIKSDIIHSKVDKKMMAEDFGDGDFEVDPADFTIQFV